LKSTNLNRWTRPYFSKDLNKKAESFRGKVLPSRKAMTKIQVAAVIIILLLPLLTALYCVPALASQVIDQTYRWNAFRSITGGTSISSPEFLLWVPYRSITIQYLELHARVNNAGPGAFAFDMVVDVCQPGRTAVLSGPSVLPSVLPSGFTRQGVAFGWINEGYSADIWFAIDFLAQNYITGPPGVPVLHATNVKYYENNIYVEEGEKLAIMIVIFSFAASNAYLHVAETWVRIKLLSFGVPVPEFPIAVTTPVMFFIITLLAVHRIYRARTKRIHCKGTLRLVSHTLWLAS
jgi:hypothetical protein